MGKGQLFFPFLLKMGLPKGQLFKFEMSINTKLLRRDNSKNVVPCIVDYFLSDRQLDIFEKQFCYNPIVLISSLEVYERLKSLGTRVNVIHCPLTLPDLYKINGEEKYDKKFDCVLFGRQNKVLLEYLEQYANKHKDFTYLKEGEQKLHYYSSNGEYVGCYSSRKLYIELMKNSRVLLYSTPGIDGGEKRTNGYNQVTPKFLEALACGCNIIARWKENADTLFYRLSDFSENINSYDQFEIAMDKARTQEPNMHKYSEYLKGHYTSTIIPIIRNAMDFISKY